MEEEPIEAVVEEEAEAMVVVAIAAGQTVNPVILLAKL
jgi:hypothetical protein